MLSTRKRSRGKKYVVAAAIVLLVLVSAELLLRKVYGFCDAVLLREDKSFEYISQASQDRFRFRKHLYYNKYSMRSPELTEADSVRILGLGDSVINGGTLTDQDSLATTLLSKGLTQRLRKRTVVLNISAGSWGPENTAAYIQKYGDFNARAMILVVSSHDAYDIMTFAKSVDISPDSRSQQYPLALYELWHRYFWYRYVKPLLGESADLSSQLGINTTKIHFNTGFSFFHEYSKQHSIPLIMYLHPELTELTKGEYTNMGQEIIAFCKNNNITLIQGLHEKKVTPAVYRDNYHFNSTGQRILAEILTPYIMDTIEK